MTIMIIIVIITVIVISIIMVMILMTIIMIIIINVHTCCILTAQGELLQNNGLMSLGIPARDLVHI